MNRFLKRFEKAFFSNSINTFSLGDFAFLVSSIYKVVVKERFSKECELEYFACTDVSFCVFIFFYACYFGLSPQILSIRWQ